MKTRRNRHGGVILFQKEQVDIFPELQRFTMGKMELKTQGTFGVIIQLTASPSKVLKDHSCSIKSILVKIVSIDSTLTFISKHVRETTLKNFQEEVQIHEDVCERSLKKFNCSITPTLLYAKVYTHEELMGVFPAIGEKITTKGKVGLLFMEMISEEEKISSTLFDYYHTHNKLMVAKSIFPKARRLFIMLAQLGVLHNDFHLGNILCSPPALYIIDFGHATRITKREFYLFNSYVEANDIQNMISFLFGKRGDTITRNTPSSLFYQWLRQTQIDAYVPGIDAVTIDSQESIIRPIRITEGVCVTSKHMERRETEPREPEMKRRPSITYSFQNNENTSFAHASTHLIFHNVFHLQLSPEDTRLYIKNNCYLHLNTTTEMSDSISLEKQCGKTGATRIMLFLYIYRLITSKFAEDGPLLSSILYYLKYNGLPIPMFSSILPIVRSVNTSSFIVSVIEMRRLERMNRKCLTSYFGLNYYFVLQFMNEHSVTIIGMNEVGFMGKDSFSGSTFLLPFDQFHSRGTLRLEGPMGILDCKGIDYIICLYDKKNIRLLDPVFTDSIITPNMVDPEDLVKN